MRWSGRARTGMLVSRVSALPGRSVRLHPFLRIIKAVLKWRQDVIEVDQRPTLGVPRRWRVRGRFLHPTGGTDLQRKKRVRDRIKVLD
jgi:hypothetical protein